MNYQELENLYRSSLDEFNREHQEGRFDATTKMYFSGENKGRVTLFSPDVMLHIALNKEAPNSLHFKFHWNLEYMKRSPLAKGGRRDIIQRTIDALIIINKVVETLHS